MKKRHNKISVLIVLILVGFGLSWPAAAQNIKPAENNDFYDNVPFKELPLDSIEIAGEVTSPGRFQLKGLPLHQVMVREAILMVLRQNLSAPMCTRVILYLISSRIKSWPKKIKTSSARLLI